MTVAVLDLDGTLINPYRSSMNEREIIQHFLRKEDNLIEEAERHTLENPLEYKWRYNGLTSAFAEDPYLWRQAQVEYLWEVVRKNTKHRTSEDFSEWMFGEAIKGEAIVLMDGAKEMVRNLYKNDIQPVIVTNSSPEKGKKCAELLDMDPENVYGHAHKSHVTDESPFEINGHRCYSSRPEYRKILEEVMRKFNIKHYQELIVFGDISTLDLSLPYILGMICILKANEFKDGFKTPDVFVKYAVENGIYVVRELEIKVIL